MKLVLTKKQVEDYYNSVISGCMSGYFEVEEVEYLRDYFKSGEEVLNSTPDKIYENNLKSKFASNLFSYFIYNIEIVK